MLLEIAMAKAPQGLLVVWTDVVPAQRDDFNAWYTREHLGDRLALPGFLTGRRWQALRGSPEYFACYDTTGSAALKTPVYRDRLEHPTPWTVRVMPSFRNTVRALCEVTARAGSGSGGVAATLRLSPQPRLRLALRQWLADTGLPQAAALPGVVSGCLAESVDAGPPGPRTAEQELRAAPDQGIEWLVLLEGTEESALDSAAQELLAEAKKALGADAIAAETGVYRYLCGMTAREAGRA
jgi:hypothetical protein